MFDPENPPDTYKKFRREILETVRDTEIASDEDYETALFVVNREDEAEIVYAMDVYEKHDGEITSEEILYMAFPHIIKYFNSKFFALVMPATHNSADGTQRDIVLVVTSDAMNMHLSIAEMDREDDYIVLEEWEKKKPSDFPDIVVPFRQAITLQG